MISVARSATGLTHVLTEEDAGYAVCGYGFPAAPKEILNVDRLGDLGPGDGKLCPRCEAQLTSGRGQATPAETGGNSRSQSESKPQLTAQVRLGKCQEMSPALHVMPGLDQAFGTPLCNQGHVKYAIGAVPTALKFPAEGDVSQVSVEEGPVCSKCLKSLQRAARESGGRERAGSTTYAGNQSSAKTGAPSQQASGSSQSSDPVRPAKDLSMAPQHLKHKLSQLTELKDALLSGEIHYPAYIRKALPLQKEIQAMEAEVR